MYNSLQNVKACDNTMFLTQIANILAIDFYFSQNQDN
jgi:hypothetical protein